LAKRKTTIYKTYTNQKSSNTNPTKTGVNSGVHGVYAVSASLLAPVVLTMLCFVLYVRIYWCLALQNVLFPIYFVILLLCCIMQNMLLIVCYVMQSMLYFCFLASTYSVILMNAVLLLRRFCRSNAALQLTHSVVLFCYKERCQRYQTCNQ